MASQEHRDKSLAAKAAWPLLFMTALLQAYFGLSSVAYVFMGVSEPAAGIGALIVAAPRGLQLAVAAAGGLQAVAAAAAFVLASRRDLRGATLAVAGSIMLGWLSILPLIATQGLDFHGDHAITAYDFVVSPVIALTAATLAWRNIYPVAAALIVSAMTAAGILVVIAFAGIIAVYGF